MSKLRILIVDDSVVVRRVLSSVLSSDPDLEVAGSAPNGRIALAKIPQVNPDLVTLDIAMPEMDGLQTLAAIRKTYPHLPVIMFSSLAERGAAPTVDALLLGANDYVMKPTNVASLASGIDRVRDELVSKIKVYCSTSAVLSVPSARSLAQATDAGQLLTKRKSGSLSPRVDVVVIGVSTGGPNALAEILPCFPADFPVPILIVQHMPPLFTRFLAERLASKSRLPVIEAESDQTVTPQHAWLAPGDFHMVVQKDGGAVRIRTHQGPPENSCRPSVDVLFRSVAEVYGPHVLAVVMTGMGQDGLRGCKCIDEAGGHVLVQDEASSVVWGMPGFVAHAGFADRVLPLDQLGPEILSRTREHRDAGPSTPLRAAGPNATAGQSWR